MKFDFDQHINCHATGSLKWDAFELCLPPEQAAANPLPLWVADMDFQSPPAVIAALKQAVEQRIMGYSVPTQSCVAAICGWQKKRFNWCVDPDCLVQVSGVVTALNIAIQAFTQSGDSILIQPPVYTHFHKDVQCNDRRVAYAPLQLREGRYYFDAALFEAAIEPDTKLFILCNPHNPTGNVWSEDDLRQMGEICQRHHIMVVADEIHQDLILNQSKKHIPYASLGAAFANHSIICTAPSKTFNIAGLQVANIFITHPDIRQAFLKQMTKNGLSQVNMLGLVACEAAYTHGEAWLEAALEYIRANRAYLAHEIKTHLPSLSLISADALYLAWLDCRALGMNPEELMRFLTITAQVWLDDGRKFSKEGHGFMRINMACPRATLVEAVERLKKAIAVVQTV